jgi:hypothetical protein
LSSIHINPNLLPSDLNVARNESFAESELLLQDWVNGTTTASSNR